MSKGTWIILAAILLALTTYKWHEADAWQKQAERCAALLEEALDVHEETVEIYSKHCYCGF